MSDMCDPCPKDCPSREVFSALDKYHDAHIKIWEVDGEFFYGVGLVRFCRGPNVDRKEMGWRDGSYPDADSAIRAALPLLVGFYREAGIDPVKLWERVTLKAE